MGAGRLALYVACALGTCLMPAGTAGAAAAPSPHVVGHVSQTPEGRRVVLTISADIDGRSVLTITGRDAVWHHLTQAAPGRHFDSASPTKIGKASWLPSWPAKGENRDCGCNSSVFHGVSPPLPKAGPIEFKAVNCRELCSAVAGGGKAVITLDDDRSFSSAPYVVQLIYTAPVVETHIKGRVTDSFKEGVDNVRVVARGKGGSKQSITSDGGYYDIQLAKLKKPATYTVTASNKLYRQIDPKVRTVTARPGKDAFAAFTVATGILRGKVSELQCDEPVTKATCGKRERRNGIAVRFQGSQIGIKGDLTKSDPDGGEYSIKVPAGDDYTVYIQDKDAGDGFDACLEDTAIPVIPAAGKADDEVKCKHAVKVKAVKGARTSRDFVLVPHVLSATMDLLTFDKANRPRPASAIFSGLSDPLSPELFGDFGSGSRKTDYPIVRCRSGCATIEVRTQNLLGAPAKGSTVRGLASTPISPAYGVTEDNMDGRPCFIKRDSAEKAFRTCYDTARVDDNGRALGVYAAPGISPGPQLQELDRPVTTFIKANVTAPGYHDTVVGADLTIKPNLRPGRKGTVIKVDAATGAWLNTWTDPNTVERGVINTIKLIPEACDAFQKFLYDNVFGHVLTVVTRGKNVKIPLISKVCDTISAPSDIARVAFDNLDDKLLSIWLINQLGIREHGLISSFGIRDSGPFTSLGDVTKLIPAATTPANRFVAEYMRAWRLAHGPNFTAADGSTQAPKIKENETLQFRVYEVSHYGFVSGVMTRKPAVMISLRASLVPAPRTLVITAADGYDPLTWLP